jgi:hypothetical protein
MPIAQWINDDRSIGFASPEVSYRVARELNGRYSARRETREGFQVRGVRIGPIALFDSMAEAQRACDNDWDGIAPPLNPTVRIGRVR